MEIQSKKLRRCDVLVLKGRVDASTVGQLAEALAAVKGAGRYNIVLNLKDVTYMSSAGLGELVDAQNACKKAKRGQIKLAEVPPRIAEALDLAGLTPLFEIFGEETQAVGSF